MVYDIERLVRSVRVILDENKVSAPLKAIDDIDALSLDDIIESKLLDAVRAVETDAPTYLLGAGNPLPDTSILWDGKVGYGSGSINLPDDFMRLITFQMSDWVRAVTTAISEDDPQYELQSSRYEGIRGNYQNPIVAITLQSSGLVLEFYSCSSGPRVYVKRARYLSMPKVDENGGIDIPEKLHTAVVYYAAYLVALTMKDNIAESLLNISKDFIK